MCNKKKREDAPVMYIIIWERLKNCRDPYMMMNHKDIQVCLCRLFHTPKIHTNKIIEELLDGGFLEKMGRNQIGIFYRVVD